MDFEKYTERAKGFVQAAQNLALRENHQQFSAEHILKVLLDDEDQGRGRRFDQVLPVVMPKNAFWGMWSSARSGQNAKR